MPHAVFITALSLYSIRYQHAMNVKKLMTRSKLRNNDIGFKIHIHYSDEYVISLIKVEGNFVLGGQAT